MKFPVLLALLATASAHVHMASPAGLRAPENQLAVTAAVVDSNLNAPLNADGSNFPCKLYHLDIFANKPGSASVADWAPGSTQKVTFGAGGAPHNGGSCQLSFSVDRGKTFKVIKSFEGGCPATSVDGTVTMDPELDFEVPKDTPAGSAIFAWTWMNRVGNREMYMNCAHVTITSEGAGSETVPFDQRPEMFQANLGSGCTTVEGNDVEYPDPGPNVVISPSANLGAPKGGSVCGAVATASAAGNAPTTPDSGLEVLSAGSSSSSTTSASASSISTSPSTGLTTDPTGQGVCGPINGVSYTCTGGEHGPSCSSFGYCGNTAEHSGPGCQPQFGTCDAASSSVNALAVESSATSSPSSASSFLEAQPSSSLSSPSDATVIPSTTAATAVGTTSVAASSSASSLPPGNPSGSITATTTSSLPLASSDSTPTTTNLPIHPEGKCGVLEDEGMFTCTGSGRGCACSSAGWCGISPAHYGQGCQSAFGTCGEEAASCKVTIASGSSGTATATSSAPATGVIALTSVYTTTVPVVTVIVTTTATSEPSNATPSLTGDTATATTTDVPTTLVTQFKTMTSSISTVGSTSETAGAAGTVYPRFRRPAGSFLDFLKGPKNVSFTGAKLSPEATFGAVLRR